jgi:hypothetical protein
MNYNRRRDAHRREEVMRSILMATTVLMLATIPALALDRKGFILGFDVGPSVSYVQAEKAGGDSYDDTKLGIGFDFRIGWAPRNQLSIHYSHKGAVFVGDIGRRELTSEQQLIGAILLPILPFTIGQNNAGIGVTYYLRPDVPTLFLDATLGISIYPLEGFLELSGGGGFAVGCGYEFTEHWNVLGAVAVGLSADRAQSDEKSSAVSVIATIGYLLY